MAYGRAIGDGHHQALLPGYLQAGHASRGDAWGNGDAELADERWRTRLAPWTNGVSTGKRRIRGSS